MVLHHTLMRGAYVEHTQELAHAPQTVPFPDVDLRRPDWPALHQGGCGNCYSYAAAAAVESAAVGAHVSENELTACTSPPSGGCAGGWFAQTLAAMVKRSYACLCEASLSSHSQCRLWPHGPATAGGVASYGASWAMQHCSSSHPWYQWGCVDPSRCGAPSCPSTLPVVGYRAYTSGIYLGHGYTHHCGASHGLSCADTISVAIKSGRAVAVAIDATGGSHGGLANDDFWSVYTGDTAILYGGCNPEAVELNHAVAIVGEVNNYSTPYWIVRNSWGDQWHDHGYFYVAKGINSCGIESRLAYVTSTVEPPVNVTGPPTPPPSPMVTRDVGTISTAAPTTTTTTTTTTSTAAPATTSTAAPTSGPDVVCCKALTASCLACAAGVTVTEFCASAPGVAGCDAEDDSSLSLAWPLSVGVLGGMVVALSYNAALRRRSVVTAYRAAAPHGTAPHSVRQVEEGEIGIY